MSIPRRLVPIAGLVLAVALVLTLRPDEEVAAPVSPPAVPSVTPDPAAERGSTLIAPQTVHVALPRLVDVGADQCIPCKAMAPILEELRREYAGRLRVDFVDAWKHPEQAAPFHVYGIPTQIFYDPSGRELHRHAGFISKEEILATWRRLGIPLTPKETT